MAASQAMDGMESHASSKTSKARSSRDRGPKRKTKALARLQEYRNQQGLAEYDPNLRFKNASRWSNETVATTLQNKKIADLHKESGRLHVGTTDAVLVHFAHVSIA
jgi:hypothetical protein